MLALGAPMRQGRGEKQRYAGFSVSTSCPSAFASGAQTSDFLRAALIHGACGLYAARASASTRLHSCKCLDACMAFASASTKFSSASQTSACACSRFRIASATHFVASCHRSARTSVLGAQLCRMSKALLSTELQSTDFFRKATLPRLHLPGNLHRV